MKLHVIKRYQSIEQFRSASSSWHARVSCEALSQDGCALVQAMRCIPADRQAWTSPLKQMRAVWLTQTSLLMITALTGTFLNCALNLKWAYFCHLCGWLVSQEHALISRPLQSIP